MNGERANLFATDPPYAISYTGNERPNENSGKDWSAVYKEIELTEDDSLALYRGFMKAAIDEAIDDHAAWYCWHASKRHLWLEGLWAEFGVMLHQQIIWLKTRPVLTRSTYLWKHEPCLYGWVKGNKPLIVEGMLGRHSTIWEAENPHGSEDNLHPTSKPTLLFEIPMLTHTLPRQICYEPFSGSGSQMVAGEKLGRLVYGLEISSYFVAGMLQRISEIGCNPRLVQV
jgi:DNA modification methylase